MESDEISFTRNAMLDTVGFKTFANRNCFSISAARNSLRNNNLRRFNQRLRGPFSETMRATVSQNREVPSRSFWAAWLALGPSGACVIDLEHSQKCLRIPLKAPQTRSILSSHATTATGISSLDRHFADGTHPYPSRQSASPLKTADTELQNGSVDSRANVTGMAPNRGGVWLRNLALTSRLDSLCRDFSTTLASRDSRPVARVGVSFKRSRMQLCRLTRRAIFSTAGSICIVLASRREMWRPGFRGVEIGCCSVAEKVSAMNLYDASNQWADRPADERQDAGRHAGAV